VDELLAHVSELEREVIRLYLFERLTMKQIASQVNRTYAVVRHNFYNGLNKMRSLLDERDRL
jgi:DNA-directed RNA polymerase specialized sigma24 family protein